MGFAGSLGSHEDEVTFLIDEGQIQEGEDLSFVYRFREGEVEGINGFESGKAGLEDAGFDFGWSEEGGDFF